MQKISRIIFYYTINTCFFGKFFLLVHRSGSPFDFAHPWAQPFGRPSFGIRPIRLFLPNCGSRRLAALCFFIFLNLLLPLNAAEAKDLPEFSSHCQATREKANKITPKFIKFMLVQTGEKQKFRLLDSEEMEKAMDKYDVLIEHINCLEKELKNKSLPTNPSK